MKKYIFFTALVCMSITLYAGTPISARDRALSHFNTHYQGSERATWVFAGKNSMYCFLQKADVTLRAFYNNHGDWLYTLRSYPPAYLPEHLQKIIADRYKGFSMDYVDEIITEENDPVYTIHIQNEHRVKIIRLMGNGDNEVIESMNKQ
jgi:hypothetical protein